MDMLAPCGLVGTVCQEISKLHRRIIGLKEATDNIDLLMVIEVLSRKEYILTEKISWIVFPTLNIMP